MHPFMTASKSVKNRAYSVGNASGNKEDNAICAHNFNGRFYENNNNPSHSKVANHRKYAVFKSIAVRVQAITAQPQTKPNKDHAKTGYLALIGTRSIGV